MTEIDLTRWKQIGRQRLTAEETKAYIAGNSPASVERSFDHVVVTEIKKNPLRAIQTVYERVFVYAYQSMINDQIAKPADFENQGGWVRSIEKFYDLKKKG